jgi:GDP-D-mannose dehydratase
VVSRDLLDVSRLMRALQVTQPDAGSRWYPANPAFVRPLHAVELVGNASKARATLKWSPAVGSEELVGRMVDADLRAL